MQIVFMGSNQAGCLGLVTLLALGHNVEIVIAYDDSLKATACIFSIPVFGSINSIQGHQSDLLISVHGREIVLDNTLETFRFGGINLHPCLSFYKGANPIGRLLVDGGKIASVGAHRMTNQVDEGKVLVEEFVDIEGCLTAEEVYNKLYPLYISVLVKALEELDASIMATARRNL